MNNSKKLLLTAAVAVLFSTAAPVQASDVASSLAKASLAQKAFGAAFFASLLRYNIRRGDNNPSRCNFERLKNSVMGTLNEKNNTITCTILGYDLSRADKKELKAIVVGIRTEQNEMMPLTKIEILKIEKADLKKACESRVLDEAPAYAANNEAVQAEYWIKPELTCKVKLFAVNKTEHDTPVSYVVIDPQFVDMTKNKTIATEKELATLHATQAVSARAVANEIWGIIDDGIIGHAGKAGGAEADLTSGKIIAGTATAPKGIYGHIQHYWRPLGLAATTYGTIWAIQNPKAASEALANTKFMLAPILTYVYNTFIC
ncbi:hypothetical protein, partial [Methylicorpusculum sp.]|uniref:hypothetical protein n=1 Tax=Methylicorpusculum sp. TaxID=2713644 RepID=UPI002ABA9D87